MARRSTREKAEAQRVARNLYVIDGFSLKEIRQQTGEPMRTLKAWCNLGDWERLRVAETETELSRLMSLRDGLLDKAEAQSKEGKLPHTEIGLVYKLERLIFQREKQEESVQKVMSNTLQYLFLYLIENEPDLAQVLIENERVIDEFPLWIAQQHLTRSPEETSRLARQVLRQKRELAKQQGFSNQLQELARRQR